MRLRRLPALRPVVASSAEQVGVLVLVDAQHQRAVGQHGRRAEPVEHVERPKRLAPPLASVGGEADQPELLEERIDVRAVGHRAGRGRPVDVLAAPGLCARHLAPPQLASGLAIEPDDEQRVALLLGRVRREEDARVAQHGRGVARRQRRLPHARSSPARSSPAGRSASETPVPFGPRNRPHDSRSAADTAPQASDTPTSTPIHRPSCCAL